MKLTLEQTNIETAVRTYLQATYGLSLRNKETTMEFKAGRGSNGVTVLVSIEDVTIPGEAAPANVGGLVGNADLPKPSAADKVVETLNAAPEGTLGAAIAASTAAVEVAAVTETPVVVVAEQEPTLETNDPLGATAEPEPVVVVEAEADVPALTTEGAVQEEAEVQAAPVTTTGLFN